MAVNPDPKPGRWILPLVLLAMIAFTYFFVSALPEASPDTTLVAGDATTTSAPDGTGTTEPDTGDGGPLPPATQEYLTEIESVNSDLQVLVTDMVTVNDQFDADPREIEYSDIEARMDTIASETQVLADRIAALTPPEGLESNQTTLSSAIDLCAVAAAEALEGLRSADTGEFRRAAVATYVDSANDFDIEVQNTKTAAGA